MSLVNQRCETPLATAVLLGRVELAALLAELHPSALRSITCAPPSRAASSHLFPSPPTHASPTAQLLTSKFFVQHKCICIVYTIRYCACTPRSMYCIVYTIQEYICIQYIDLCFFFAIFSNCTILFARVLPSLLYCTLNIICNLYFVFCTIYCTLRCAVLVYSYSVHAASRRYSLGSGYSNRAAPVLS